MLKSVISFVMALVFVAVSVVGLNYEKAFVTKAAETSSVASNSVQSKAGGDIFERTGIFGFKWDDRDKVYYSAHEAWQRNFGYNRLYDIMAQFLMLFYDTCRVKFNYSGKDYLIQFWKGQYGFLLVGAEVGVYSKDEKQPIEHYECARDEDLFTLGYTLYSNDEVLFVRSYQDTWWLTGFVPGIKLERFYDRSQLSMHIRITLKSEGMKDKFVEALKKPGVGFKEGNAQDKDTFYVIGNDVYIMWNTDRNRTS